MLKLPDDTLDLVGRKFRRPVGQDDLSDFFQFDGSHLGHTLAGDPPTGYGENGFDPDHLRSAMGQLAAEALGTAARLLKRALVVELGEPQAHAVEDHLVRGFPPMTLAP